ncbi:hypothetical protein ES703_112017 [subsurface metagenome]
MVSINFGPVQTSLNTLVSIVCRPFKWLAGTQPLLKKVDELYTHISAMTACLHIILADLMGKWTPEQRERALKAVANFTVADRGLNNIKPKSNPFTEDELQRLHLYTQQAQRGEFFSTEQALDYKQLTERTAREYSGQDWAIEILKIGLFIFALYGLN